MYIDELVVGGSLYDIQDKRIDNAEEDDVEGKALVRTTSGEFYWSTVAGGGGGGGGGSASSTTYTDTYGVGVTNVQTALDFTINSNTQLAAAVTALSNKLDYILEHNQLVSAAYNSASSTLSLNDITLPVAVASAPPRMLSRPQEPREEE